MLSLLCILSRVWMAQDGAGWRKDYKSSVMQVE